MSGKVFVAHKGEPGGENELPTQQYVDDSVNRLDTRHQALSNNHGTTRAALQRLISDVHGPHTTLADGASTFDLVQSELGQYRTITTTLEHTVTAMDSKLSDYVKATDLETATVQTAATLSPGGTINGQPFTGQEKVVLDTVSQTTLQNTVALLATKSELSDYVRATDLRTATVQTATTLSPGGTINGQLFTGQETVILDSISQTTLEDTLANDASNILINATQLNGKNAAEFVTQTELSALDTVSAQDLADTLADYTKTADMPSGSGSGSGSGTEVFVYLPGDHVTPSTWPEMSTDVVAFPSSAAHALAFQYPEASVSRTAQPDPDSLPRWIVSFGQQDVNGGYQACWRTPLVTVDGGSTYLLNCSTSGGGTNRNRSSPLLIVPENDSFICYVWRHSDQRLGIMQTPVSPSELPSIVNFVNETQTVSMTANTMHNVVIRHRRLNNSVGSGTMIECTFMVNAYKARIFVSLASLVAGSSLDANRLAIGSWGRGVSGAHLNLRATKIKMWPYSLTDHALVGELNK